MYFDHFKKIGLSSPLENNQNDINKIGVNNLLMIPDMIKPEEKGDQNVDASDDSLDNEVGALAFMTVREFAEFKSIFIIINNLKD